MFYTVRWSQGRVILWPAHSIPPREVLQQVVVRLQRIAIVPSIKSCGKCSRLGRPRQSDLRLRVTLLLRAILPSQLAGGGLGECSMPVKAQAGRRLGCTVLMFGWGLKLGHRQEGEP